MARKKSNKGSGKSPKRLTREQMAMKFFDSAFSMEDTIANSLRRRQRDFMKLPNVMGFGVGFKCVGGVFTSEICATFFVSEKLPLGKLAPSHRIPKSLRVRGKQIKTDVVEVTRIKTKHGIAAGPQQNQNLHRPVRMGSAIKSVRFRTNQMLKSGTAGALVSDRNNPIERLLLSAGHVLFRVGDDVVQPWWGRNADPPPGMDRHENIGGIRDVAGTFSTGGKIDAAIAEVIPATNEIIHIGPPKPSIKPRLGMYVQKSGAQTGHTYSSIIFTNVTALNNFFATAPLFLPTVAPSSKGLFFVLDWGPLPPPGAYAPHHLFSGGGDSGSLIVAGSPFHGLGPAIEAMLRLISLIPRIPGIVPIPGRLAAQLIRLRLDRAALGLLTAGLNMGSIGFTIGQEIDLALNALNVDLVI